MAKVKIRVDTELKEILPGYLEKRKKEINVLEGALSAGDFATIETLGHRLKGSGGGYGIQMLGEIGAKLELAGRARNFEQATMAVKELKELLENLEIED